MANKVTCEGCGERIDSRGLSAHQQFNCDGDSDPVAVADGGSQSDEAGAVTVQKDDLDVPDEELDEALPAANVTENAITFRTMREIQVTDEEMKRELLEELKEYIRGGTLRV
jgi:hypothetical protein